jgi:hypothetical protein
MHSTIVASSQMNNINNRKSDYKQADQLKGNAEICEIKDHKFAKRKPLASLLKNFTFLHESETDKNQLNKLRNSFDDLLALDDDLILLILENNVLNVLIHKQKIFLEAISAQSNREERISPYAGIFEKHERRVAILNSRFLDYSDTLIHELTHAATGFTFSFDPWPVQYRLSLFNNEELRNKIFVENMVKFRQAPGFPHPAHEANHRETSFNIAALKFKQCVYRDLHNYTEKEEYNLFSEKYDISRNIASYMSTLKPMVTKDGDGIEILQEILPYYIQCRFEILKIARDKKIPASAAISMLAEAMPNIHAYCETDFRKVLKHRLEYYHHHYYSGYYSEYLEYHANKEPQSVRTTKTAFCEDGSLKFYRNEYTPKRNAEFSCAMFALRTRNRTVTESAQIAVEMDEIARPNLS